MKVWQWLLLGIGIAVAILVSFWLGQKCPNVQISKENGQVDTLVIRDTIVIVKPISVTRTVIDTVFVPVIDTIRLRDTLFLKQEKERVIWKDSLSEVYASGIMASIDSVKHFQQIRVIKETVKLKDKKWGVGVQFGYGASKEGLSPYVGIGISWNILTF